MFIGFLWTLVSSLVCLLVQFVTNSLVKLRALFIKKIIVYTRLKPSLNVQSDSIRAKPFH